jgi:hypothetical protein
MNMMAGPGFGRAQKNGCLRLLKKTIFEEPEIGGFILGLGNATIVALGLAN